MDPKGSSFSPSSRGLELQLAIGDDTILEPSEQVQSPTPLAFAPAPGATSSAPTPSETVRRRPGRPRIHKTPSEIVRGRRGRPRKYGHGRGGRLLSGSAAGPRTGLTTHLIVVNPGENIVEKILAFARQLQRVVCVLSGTGSVSVVNLGVPTTSGSLGFVTYEGLYEILCLSGSFVPTFDGESSNPNGGLNILFSRSDGSVSGGRVGERLIAANRVQVILVSFEWKNQEGQEVGTSSGQQQTPITPTTG